MTHIGFASTAAARSKRIAPVSACATLVQAFVGWFEERRAISQLRELDDCMLRDMGISRGEIRAAVRGEIHRR